jgi:hypothetical protein
MIRIERDKVVRDRQQFFLVCWESNDPNDRYTWDPASFFAEDDPKVCEYFAKNIDLMTTSTQTPGSICFENSVPITADPDPFQGFIPPPSNPGNSEENDIPNRGIPIGIVRYLPNEESFVVVLADSTKEEKVEAQTLLLIAPLLIADFFLGQERQKLDGESDVKD